MPDPFREVKRVSHKHGAKDKLKFSSKATDNEELAKLRARGRRSTSDWLVETYKNLTITKMSSSKSQSAEAADGIEADSGNRVEVDVAMQSSRNSESGVVAVASEQEDATTKNKESVDNVDSVVVACGNPNVELVHAVIHFYKLNERVSTTSVEVLRPTLLCVLGVPSSITLKELLGVLGSWTDLGQLREVKVLRPADTRSNAYMTLLQFADNASADCFFANANGRAYSSFDVESICSVIYVDRLELGNDAAAHFEGLGGLARVTELPQCPVCLERLDEPVQGMLASTLCNHIFHASCLIQWTDNK